MMDKFEEFVLRLTDKVRQQELSEIEAGVLRSVGQVAELQAKNRRLEEKNEKLVTAIKTAVDFLSKGG